MIGNSPSPTRIHASKKSFVSYGKIKPTYPTYIRNTYDTISRLIYFRWMSNYGYIDESRILSRNTT